MNLNVSLAIFGGILGLIVTGTALYTAWMIHQLWKQQAASCRQLDTYRSCILIPVDGARLWSSGSIRYRTPASGG
jgi:hypothetical protein